MAFYEDAVKKRNHVRNTRNEEWEEEKSQYRNGRESRREDRNMRTAGRTGSRNAKPAGSRLLRQEERDERRQFGMNPRQRQEDFAPKRPGMKYPEERKNPEGTPEKSGWQDFEYRPADPRKNNHAETETEIQENILCGRNPIREALRSGRDIEKILVQKGELSGSAREIVQEARERKIMIQAVEKRRMDEIAPHHQGLIAYAAAYPYATVEDMLKKAREKNEAPFLVILDGITDPHNLGAIIRTAECVGAHGVIIPQHRSVGLTPSAVKASAGAIEHMMVAKVTNLNRTIDDLKRSGVWIYAVTMDGKDYEKVDFRGGAALIIGAEGEGISRLTLEKCDLAVSLPIKGKLDSLNASVAAGIMMYRVLSSRKK